MMIEMLTLWAWAFCHFGASQVTPNTLSERDTKSTALFFVRNCDINIKKVLAAVPEKPTK